MKIDISEIKVYYQNGTLAIGVLNNDGIDFNKTSIGTVENLKDFDQQVLNFLHNFIIED